MSQNLKPLPFPDRFHLEAAEGWLGLGNPAEAQAELKLIRPRLRRHPGVLEVLWTIHAQSRHWEQAADVAESLATVLPEKSFGWIHWAYSLHELNRTAEALAVLEPVSELFPDQFVISYNLACYHCQLGNGESSLKWLKEAMAKSDREEIREMALNDPDLKPLWQQIRQI